jgi:S1-C subfamily serine protease
MASITAAGLAAQEPRITRIGPGTIVAPGGRFGFTSEEPRAVIGVSTTNASSSRDTLGVLVSSVRSGSPAEKAGIEEGNRIASINGVSLKLAGPDVGDEQMAGVLSRRLGRELDRLNPGDEVDLRVYANGQTRTVKVKAVSPTELYASDRPRRADERATLGINLASTGSSRDSIGVFVMSVDDGGPAAKAGIEEGTRIASINGVDLRAKRAEDDNDLMFRTSTVSRLERELSRAKPGDDVDLRVYYNGQFRNVKVKAGRASDLPRRNRVITVGGSDHMLVPPMMGFPDRLSLDIPDRIAIDIDGAEIGANVRRALESARIGTGRIFGRLGGRMDW